MVGQAAGHRGKDERKQAAHVYTYVHMHVHVHVHVRLQRAGGAREA